MAIHPKEKQKGLYNIIMYLYFTAQKVPSKSSTPLSTNVSKDTTQRAAIPCCYILLAFNSQCPFLNIHIENRQKKKNHGVVFFSHIFKMKVWFTVEDSKQA